MMVLFHISGYEYQIRLQTPEKSFSAFLMTVLWLDYKNALNVEKKLHFNY